MPKATGRARFPSPAASVMRVLLLVLLASGATLAQPVVSSQAVGPAVPGAEPLAAHVAVVGADGWEAPPALYWAGVGLDATALAGGTYLLVQSVRVIDALDDGEGPGLGGGIVYAFGLGGAMLGTGVAGAALYDLARVLRGDDPFLARVFDPTRPLPGGPPPRYPPPEPPRYPGL